MVEVTYLIDFGTAKKGEKRQMYLTTAKPLKKAKIIDFKEAKEPKED